MEAGETILMISDDSDATSDAIYKADKDRYNHQNLLISIKLF
jgi:hypothetical protein